MRRLLAIALAAGPLAAAAQTAGQILFDSNTTATITRAQCEGSGTMKLDFKLLEQVPGVDFVSGTGEVTLYAASADKTDSVFPPCHYVGDGSSVTVAALLADPIANPASLTGTATGPISTLVTAAGFTCTTDNKPIYVCAIWKNGASPPVVKAYAKGSVTLKGAIPEKPTVGPVAPGDGALYVTVTPGARVTGDAKATKIQAKAVETVCPTACVTTPHLSPVVAFDTAKGNGEVKIPGLSNDIEYTVTAFAYADDGNVSAESDCFRDPAGAATCTTVQPVPSADAWRHYKDLGGRDSGGCDAGPAGLLALLGAAALLRLGRRS
jgi:hypothetical protein